MSRLSLVTIVLLIFVGVAALTLRLPGVPTTLDAAEMQGAGEAADRGPIVVELFTSQGCSSCPPADRLLSRLGSEGHDIIPLAFHVDYWDYIGWQDPFASAAWSKRQELYARSLEAGRLYTPQLVVDGREHCVGSRSADVEHLLAEARRRQQASRLEVAGELAPDGRQVRVAVAGIAVGAANGASLELQLAIVENGLRTAVTRGENAQRALHNDHVVRRLQTLTEVPGDGSDVAFDVSVDLDDDWQANHLRVVVFLQDPDSRKIYGAGQWKVVS